MFEHCGHTPSNQMQSHNKQRKMRMKEWRVERTEEWANGLRKTIILVNPEPSPPLLPSSAVFSLYRLVFANFSTECMIVCVTV